ncbi:IclR family transcriptional regulator [Lederbergia citrea]|uniref:IclR family transcriptional regulator n=1 Tax=Lederbergia citrea TaxID=2833581 RepID=A0A942Z6E5_9BACI|nr:IclR family transcriptional regulator [Lederbergia citrea]MBS4205450.1 IclR family transcriptional regulator [Lederbergia citrea]MBS4224232.1 IclR family transcriptional regulator [Lederbergia citrea]
MKKKKDYNVPALEKGLLILEWLSKSEEPLRITDIHEQLGIPKTSVFMMMSTLEAMEYVEKVDDSRYRVTMKLYNIGIETKSKYDIRRIARPYMEKLAQKLRFTVHLAILSNGRAVYIEKVNGPTFVQFDTKVGQSMHIHSSAVGKVLAAYLDEETVDEILENNPMVRATENTITSPELFKQFLANVRETGYAVEDEEGEIGVRCLGAPIFNDNGKVIAALSVTGVRNDLHSIHFQEIGNVLKEECSQISEQIGYKEALNK